jgi:hypothetical protein
VTETTEYLGKCVPRSYIVEFRNMSADAAVIAILTYTVDKSSIGQTHLGQAESNLKVQYTRMRIFWL